MLRIFNKLDRDILALIKRHYLNDPIRFTYLFYDIMYYPEVTEAYLSIVGNDITGFVLIYEGLSCPAVHIIGNIDEPLDYIPRDRCLRIYAETRPEITRQLISELMARNDVKVHQSLTMVCHRDSFKPFSLGGNYVVRRLLIDDLEELAKIKEMQGSKVSRVELIARLLSPHWHYYGVFMNGKLLSIATAYLKLPEVWVVGDVFTIPEHRNRGLAKAVTSAVTNDAMQSGAMAMLHVYEENLPAIKAYRRLGYVAVQEFTLIVS